MEQETAIRMDEINLITVLKDLLWNLPFIILAAVTVLMGVRTYRNLVYEPEYTASTTLAVMAKGNTDGSAYSSLNTANSMAEVFIEVFQSDVMKEKVEEAMGEMPEGTRITSEIIPQTNLLQLRVTTKDPQSAYRVLRVILKNYRNVSDYIFGNAVMEVILDPEVPVAPSNSFQTARLDKIGVLAAVMFMAGLVMLFSVLRNTVKTVKAAKRNLEGECLSVLPYEVKNRTLKTKIHKSNKAVLISNPIISFGYEEGCHRLASRVEYKAGKKDLKVILVTSVAENEGKSTVAVNLAAALARRNKKVLLIDMDIAKPAVYRILECKLNKNQGLLSFLRGEMNLGELLQYDEKRQIYTIVNRQSVEDAQKYFMSGRMGMLLEAAGKTFDYVILDSAPVSAGTDTEYLQEYADASVLVVRKDRVRISDINDTVEMLKEGNTEFLGYVLNGFDKFDLSGQSGYGYGKYGYGKYGNYSRKTRKVPDKTEE